MVFEMFSSDYDQLEIFRNTKLVHFYGNDGVCLFKYFVDKDDPQKLFVWAILGLNFLCFTFVSASYLIIVLISRKSGRNASSSVSGGKTKRGSKRVNEMNRRIAFIIATDFVCWIPFICICVLHSLELIDATPWYSLFSMMILPINSVINPLIYDDTIARIPRLSVRVFQNNVRKLVIVQNLRTRAQQLRPISEPLENRKTFAHSIISEDIIMKDMTLRNVDSTCEKQGGSSRNTEHKEGTTCCSQRFDRNMKCDGSV